MTFGISSCYITFSWRFLAPINNAEKPPKVRHFDRREKSPIVCSWLLKKLFKKRRTPKG